MLTPTRVLIVGGQTLFAETLAQALSRDPETEVVGCCSSVSRALEVLTRCNVRVILHLRESEERGVNLMLALRNQRCESAVVVITSGLNDHLEQEVIQQGVSSIFNTSAGIEALLERIRTASIGITTLDERSFRQGQAPRVEQDGCTPRDHRVEALLLEGLANKEIGARLGISEGAVKNIFSASFGCLEYITAVRWCGFCWNGNSPSSGLRADDVDGYRGYSSLATKDPLLRIVPRP